MYVHYLQGEGGKDYLLMLSGIRGGLDKVRTMRPTILAYCRLDSPYDTLPFLSWSKTWREAFQYEINYCGTRIDGERYFVEWNNRKLFMVPLGKLPKLYVRVPLWRKKYEPCRALLVPTSCVFAHASRVLIEKSLGWKALNRAALTDHCVMVVMVFLQRVHS